MANITERTTKSGETRYKVVIRKRGTPTQTATFKRKTDAVKWAKQTEAAIEEGRAFRSVEAKRRTLADLIERYISDKLPQKEERSRSKGHRSATKQRLLQENQLKLISKKWGYLTLADATPSKLREIKEWLRKGRSGGTVNRYLAVLSHAFTFAVQDLEWIDTHPMAGKRFSRESEPRGRVRFLSEEERKRLLKVCKEHPEPLLYPIVLAAVTTGARRSEITSLRWSDVDLENGRAVVLNTKNARSRGIPLPDVLVDELRTLRKVRQLRDDRVFPIADGRLEWCWQVARKRAGLEDFRFHDLRHTAASYLAMNGATLVELADILGHRTLAMVQRYSHLAESHHRDLMNRASASVVGIDDAR